MDILTNNAQSEFFKDVLGIELPTSSNADELRETVRTNGRKSLYYFTTAILNYDKVQRNPHLELCNFIQAVPPRRKFVLIPRDCYKSTIGSKSLPLWILVQESFCGIPGLEHRILLASYSSENAKKQIKAIRAQVERNSILRWAYPEIIPDLSRTTWTDSALLFPREGVYGEETIESAGVDTHLVSRHYTVQIDDDLEDLESFQSPTVRRKVKDWYKASEALFVSEQEAFHLLIGTRWGVDDVYHDIQQQESETYARLIRPLQWTRAQLQEDLAEAKQHERSPTWDMDPDKFAPDPDVEYFFFPALFPKDSCRRVRAKQGNFMYSMLYLNNPRDASLAEFSLEYSRFFSFNTDGDIVIDHGGGDIETVPYETLRLVMFWDPALSKADKIKNARNAIVVMGKDPKGRLFLVEAFAQREDPTILFAKFIGFHRRYHVHRAGIEDVAFQKVLKFPLYREMRDQGYSFPVHDERPIGDKHYRIRSLIPYHESYMMYVRRGLKDFLEERDGFPLFPTVDLLDGAAACIPMFSKVAFDSGSKPSDRAADKQRQEGRSALTGY